MSKAPHPPDRTERRIQRIRRIPLGKVLHRLGYRVDPDAEVEQQFGCNLHGTGQDTKPSARYYPGSSRWHCFACSTSRDAVQTYRERHGVTLDEALDRLEAAFHLGPIPWEEEPVPVAPELAWAGPDPNPLDQMGRLLQTLGRARSRPLGQLLQAWELVDRARIDEDFAARLAPRLPEMRKKLVGPC